MCDTLVITALLGDPGQGGGCGHEDRGFTYHSSFLVADPDGAVVLETAGRLWASERVTGPVRSISNVLTIPPFAGAHGARLHTRIARGRERLCRTRELAADASAPADLMRMLRDHGAGREAPRFHWATGTLAAPCMHGGATVANSVTTAAWVSELRRDGVRHWATATAAPCLSLFKPVRLDQPLDLGSPTDRADGSLWWRHERLHRRVLTDPRRLGALVRDERDEVEARWLARPPDPRDAFAEADRLLAKWEKEVRAAQGRNVGPPWARRYWRIRSSRAGLRI